MGLRSKRSKIFYLLVVLVSVGLLMVLYLVKSENHTVDLHKVYAEHQSHIGFDNHEAHRYRELPQINKMKSWEEQLHYPKTQSDSKVWKLNRRLVNTRMKINNQSPNYLFHQDNNVEKQFPVIKAQSSHANNLGIDVDEANKQSDIYVEISKEDIQQPQGPRPTENHLQLPIIQPTKVLHHYVTTTQKPLIRHETLQQTSLAHATTRPQLALRLPQPTPKSLLVPAREEMEQLVMQLSQYVTDSNAQHLLYKLSQLKHLLPDSPHSTSGENQHIPFQELPDHFGHLSPNSDHVHHNDFVGQHPPDNINKHSGLSILTEKTKQLAKHISNNQRMLQRQNNQLKILALGKNVMQGSNVGNEFNISYNAFTRRSYVEQELQHFPKHHEHVNDVDHHSSNGQHGRSEGQKFQQGLGHDLEHLPNVDHINVMVDKQQEHQHNFQDTMKAIQRHKENVKFLAAPLPQLHHIDDSDNTNHGNALNHYLKQSEHGHKAAAQGRAIPLDRLSGQIIDKKAHYTVMHASKASQAQGNQHSNLQVLPKKIPQEAYIFEDKELPADPRLRPSIGNGHLATVIFNAHMFLSGFYNGYKEQSHRAEIPSTVSVRLDGTEPETNCSHKYKLNVGEGVFSELCSHKFYNLELRIFAHRTIPSVMVVEVELAMASYYPVTVKLQLDKWHVSGDVTFKLQQLDDMKDVSLKAGHISAPETHGMPYDEVYILYDHIPRTLKPPSGLTKVKWVFLTVVGASKNEVIQTYNKASMLIHNGDKLYSYHIQGWADLWQSAYIDISGNLTIAKAVFSSMYHLLSSIPLKVDDLWPFVGLSPSGLSLGDFSHPQVMPFIQDYKGHVFCDQELWMFAPVLTYHPELAKIMLRSRSRYAAKKAAAQLAEESGVKSSLKYPFQSAISGIELTESDDPYRQSVFTSGLISQAVLLYLHATNDTAILLDQHYGEILTSIANYYYRLLQDEKGGTRSFGIAGVQTMDKYARSVNNSVFTNAVASIALSAPDKVYKMIGRTINLNYHHYSEDIYIPFDVSGSYHLEHVNYIRGHPISQADVILLGYPLMREMTPEIRKNDLEIYEKVLDTQAPPTTWSMYAIGWLEVSNIKRGLEAFDRQFQYLLGPFQVWTEKGTSLGASNYLSAAGSYLQSITNGFLGLRYYNNYLSINPVVPPGAEYMRFVGVIYLGASLDIWVWQTHIAIQVTQTKMQELKVYTSNPLFVKMLIPGHPVTIPRTQARILPSNAELPV